MKRFFLLVVVTLMATALSAQEYKYSRDIVYNSVDEYASQMCRVDTASPEGATDAPVIVWFHGGGLTGGRRDIPQAILKDGCVVVGVGYRFSPKVRVTDIVDDAAAVAGQNADDCADHQRHGDGNNADRQRQARAIYYTAEDIAAHIVRSKRMVGGEGGQEGFLQRLLLITVGSNKISKHCH